MSIFSKLFKKKTTVDEGSKGKALSTDISSIISQLSSDTNKHTKVGKKLTLQQISDFEKHTKFQVPPSYATFLMEFGDGAYWLYGCQPIDSTQTPTWFKNFHSEVTHVEIGNNNEDIPIESLFCLMAEDSNGGAWCWLTSKRNAEGEYPLAYYASAENKLVYEVENFTKWLSLLVNEQDEVIKILDKNDELGLG
jgi:hypothetical protein